MMFQTPQPRRINSKILFIQNIILPEYEPIYQIRFYPLQIEACCKVPPDGQRRQLIDQLSP